MILAQLDPVTVVAAGKEVADSHGFNALLVVILLAGFFWLGRMFFTVWKTNNDRLTESQEKYITSQISFGEQNNKAIDKIADSMEKSQTAIDRIAVHGERVEIETRAGHKSIDRIHEAVRQTIVIAADELTDRPDLQGRLRKIAETLKVQ